MERNNHSTTAYAALDSYKPSHKYLGLFVLVLVLVLVLDFVRIFEDEDENEDEDEVQPGIYEMAGF